LRFRGGLLQVLSGALRLRFSKELDTDMPVLKILGDNLILDLASNAVERLLKVLRDLDRDHNNAGNDVQSMGDKKLPKTSRASPSSEVVTGDSGTVSQSSAINVSTTAKTTAG
jgi:hybrid polyketide synthase/nonribosomal peptide synthetase ACE1